MAVRQVRTLEFMKHPPYKKSMWKKVSAQKTPKWVKKEINKLRNRGQLKAALYKNKVIILKGKYFEYKLEPWGEGAYGLDVCLDVYRKKRHYNVKKPYRKPKPLYRRNKLGITLILAFLISFALSLGAMADWDTEVFTDISFTTFEDSTMPTMVEDIPIPTQVPLQNSLSTPAERREECKDTFNYLNKIRRDYGRKELKWDDRAYELAVDRAKDMVERNYFDHVTPEGTCAKDMKSLYGFASLEILAENCGGMTHYSDGNPIPETSVNEAVDSWMNSRGHRYNLLYEDHKSGAIGCYKSICVFYGVHFNQHGLGAGPCTSGEEGLAFWNSARKQHDEI